MPNMFTGCPQSGVAPQPIVFSKKLFNHLAKIFLAEVKSLLIFADSPLFCVLLVFLVTVA